MLSLLSPLCTVQDPSLGNGAPDSGIFPPQLTLIKIISHRRAHRLISQGIFDLIKLALEIIHSRGTPGLDI